MNSLTNNKTILLAMPIDYQLHNLIEKNLISHGFIVTKLLAETNLTPFKYKNFKVQLINFLRKTFLRDKNFKKKLVHDFHINTKIAKIKVSQNYDYALFIRSDFFEDEIIQYAKQNSNYIVSYHYDGLKRNPKIYNKITFFDKFFVFDKVDLNINNANILPCTNFYFDYDIYNENHYKVEVDFYFLGSYHHSRTKVLILFNDEIKRRGMSSAIEVVFSESDFNKKKLFEYTDIKCLEAIFPFEDYLAKIKKSKVIIDFVIDEHSGLSFRVFESIKFKKKLITTNKTLKNYDFYSPNNIFILIDNDFTNIEKFLETDYQEIPQEIKNKYSFKNFISYLLNIEPNAPLNID